MAKILKGVVKRAKQKSTWLGLAVIASLFGLHGVSDTLGQVGTAVGLVVGGAAVGYDEVTQAE